MDSGLPVYLDHLIPRDNLRYERSNREMSREIGQTYSTLDVCDLVGDHTGSRVKRLRKPDFQRATWAWSPDKCIALLESMLNGHVIPSVIMWQSADNRHDFVLDGAHRISVLMAWLRDDWGQHVASSSDFTFDASTRDRIRKAAEIVRDEVRVKIGTFDEVKRAAQRVEDAMDSGGAALSALDSRTLKQAKIFGRVNGHITNFAIQWVPGDYKTAEQSFLDINTGGQALSSWEITLIENRDSSFARLVMSISNPGSAPHYWPTTPPEGGDEAMLRDRIQGIIRGVGALHTALFEPPYEPQIKRLQQPLLAQPDVEKKPFWVAELLTVISGGRGQLAETEKLLQRDRSASSEDIIHNGYRWVQDSISALEHIAGPSPKSMVLVPALYFYSENGRYVRSLLYGLFYWLVSGDDEATILERKRAFCAHREAFEGILRTTKQDVVNRLARNSGSGPEVTYPTARYYQGLMELLITHKDEVSSKAFTAAYSSLLERLTDRKNRSTENDGEVQSRNFTGRQKSTLSLKQQLNGLDKCGICGGLIDPELPVQHDHVLEKHRGGPTSPDNQRMVHPFCNNQANREIIEAVRRGDLPTKLPSFADPQAGQQIRQLSFFDAPDFL